MGIKEVNLRGEAQALQLHPVHLQASVLNRSDDKHLSNLGMLIIPTAPAAKRIWWDLVDEVTLEAVSA